MRSYLHAFESIHLVAASPTLRASALPTSGPLKMLDPHSPHPPVPLYHMTLLDYLSGTYLVSFYIFVYLFVICFVFTRCNGVGGGGQSRGLTVFFSAQWLASSRHAINS